MISETRTGTRPGRRDAAKMTYDAARAFRERRDLEDARAAEDAWEWGIRHARAGQTPLGSYSQDEGSYPDYVCDSRYALTRLADLLGLDEGPDHPAVETAAHAYADAYDEAVGTGAGSFPLPYEPGLVISTAHGKCGVLTGASTRSGHPVIRFPDGARPMARSAIPAPLVFHFADPEAADQAVSRSSVIQDGDVVLIPDVRIQVSGCGLLPVGAAAATGRDRYASSVRLAWSHLGVWSKAKLMMRPPGNTKCAAASRAGASASNRRGRQQPGGLRA